METLAKEISINVGTITEYFQSNNLPELSFAKDGPSSFAVPASERDVHAARFRLLEAAKTIHDLVLGPSDMMNWTAMIDKYECAVLRAITMYDMPGAVPLDGEASFSQIAAHTGLGEDFVSRIIRFATTSRIFHEHRPGFVVHTAASALLAKDQLLSANIAHNVDEVYRATGKISEAAKTVDSGEPDQTAFNLACGTYKTWFEYLNENEDRKARFQNTMKDMTRNHSFSGTHIVNGFDWASLSNGLVVDVGGGYGQIGIEIARKFPDLKFMLQDQAGVLEEAERLFPHDLKDRFSFRAYDFFKEAQPVTADAYILRRIFHDWSNKRCIKILKGLIVAMKPQSRLLIMEIILPAPNTVPKVMEKLQRSGDLQMMTMLNAKERSLEDWKSLFKAADECLVVSKVTQPPGSALSVLEVKLDV